jgi:hypothetical protein
MNILPQFRPKDNAICSNPVGKKRWSARVACTASTDLKHRIMSKSRLINWIVWFFFCSFSTGGHSGWLILCDSGKLGRSFRDKSADVEQTIIRGRSGVNSTDELTISWRHFWIGQINTTATGVDNFQHLKLNNRNCQTINGLEA